MTNVKDDVNQERLKAEVELDNALGQNFVFEISPDIKEQLIRSEIMLKEYTVDNSIEIVKCLASVMQLVFFEVIVNRKMSDKTEVKIKDIAIQKIVASGFCSSITAMPEQITKVNDNRIHSTVRGYSTTLGAHLLVLFFLCSQDELIRLKKTDFRIIDIVVQLISLRGHGNEQQFTISKSDLELLRNNVFKIIKLIAEVL